MSPLRFASPDLQMDCDEFLRADHLAGATRNLAERAVPLIHRSGFVVFRLGRLRLGAEDSRALGAELSEALLRELIRCGAPSTTRLERDLAQATHVPNGFGHRTLLPHHDGQHCSYLTPSTSDDPDWRTQWREFGSRGYSTTPAHKLYQGVFIADPGEGLSVTTYYDWLEILSTVHSERTAENSVRFGDADCSEGSPAEIARWLGANLRRALDRQPDHGTPYPSLGSMLGLDEPMWHGLSFHHAEAELGARDRERYPSAIPLAETCPCGTCVGESARVFCHMMLAATGQPWRECRERWEVLAPSERFDLVFGHNLTMLHGGWAGGPGRVIEPMCLVVDRPEGEEYERWLAASWRRHLPAL